MARMTKTTVYLPASLLARVKQVAADRAESEAEVIRAALDEFTARNAPKPTLPLFSAGEIAPIDDWDEALHGFGDD
jgi:hypothetical protein